MFSPDVKKSIEERDGHLSAQSRVNTVPLEAAHWSHARGNDYNSADNGRFLTRPEHFDDHLYRLFHPEIGLSIRAGIWALQKIWDRLTDRDRCGRINPYEVWGRVEDMDFYHPPSPYVQADQDTVYALALVKADNIPDVLVEDARRHLKAVRDHYLQVSQYLDNICEE